MLNYLEKSAKNNVDAPGIENQVIYAKCPHVLQEFQHLM